MTPLLARFALLLVLFAGAGRAAAVSYFVDPNRGNDAYSGTAALAATGNVGPWQTLGRLATASLLPGDVVYLACGSVWNETLRVSSSGTSLAPITVAGGPGTCATAPLIDGAIGIPANAWVQHSGAIYKARLPADLVVNSTPTANLAGWTLWSAAGNANQIVDPACPESLTPCMKFTSGSGNSLAISNNFPIVGAADYSFSVQVRAPVGVTVRAILRRGGPTYEALAPMQISTGSGGWKTLGVSFRAASSVPNARLDIEVIGAFIPVHVREAHVQRTMNTATVLGTFVDGLAVRRAHHPNFAPSAGGDSPYASIASAGAKTTLDASALSLPPGAALVPGLGVVVRSIPFAVESRTVASVTGAQLALSAPTTYSLLPGYGFFLTGALWMLDAPGEWFYDAQASTLYLWMPDGKPPGSRVAVSSQSVGANLAGRAYVNLEGLNLRRVNTGLSFVSGNQLTAGRVGVSDTVAIGVDGENCVRCSIRTTVIERTGGDAVAIPGALAEGFSLTDSTVSDAAGSARTDGWRTLPAPTRAGVYSIGPQSTIQRNNISGVGNIGIYVGPNATVSNNYIGQACRLLNDCSAIYANFLGNNALISGNVVENVVGNLTGLPGAPGTHTVGIYLDDRNALSTVDRNTVTGADYGIQLHDASSTTVSNNTLFGNRRYQVWMQEQTKILRTVGDIFSNRMLSNQLVPTASGPAIYMESEVGDTVDFSSFTGNRYSALYSPRVIGERTPTGGTNFSEAEWRSTGRESAPLFTQPTGYASFLASAVNLIPNGNLAGGLTGWTWWNLTAPKATASLLNCVFAPCVTLVAGASTTLLSSPNFSVVAGQWYRISFDAATSAEGQPISVLVRRGGGGTAGYEPLVPAGESFSGTTAWRRYSFNFQATKTVNAGDPVTRELGARVDFERIQPGSTLRVSRLEMVALTPVQAALQVKLVLNRQPVASSLDCAALAIAPATCASFAYIDDGSSVVWPVSLPALSSRPIYTRDAGLLDTDGDGIADQQDFCAGTVKGLAVNARGCAFNQ